MKLPRVRLTVRTMMVVVAAVSAGFASMVSGSETLAGVVLLLTLGTLVLAILGVVYRRGEARASWLGFALLGWSYMLLASGSWWDRAIDRPQLVTSEALDHLYRLLPHERDPKPLASTFARLFGRTDPRDDAILAKLDQPVSMNFGDDAPMEDVLKYVRSVTQGPADAGIPIHVDPVGLKAARQTMKSPVSISVEGAVPLRTTLPTVLRQLGLTYDVRGGLLTITKGSPDPLGIDSFVRIGHCYWGLLAAWMGGIAGRAFWTTRDGSVQE